MCSSCVDIVLAIKFSDDSVKKFRNLSNFLCSKIFAVSYCFQSFFSRCALIIMKPKKPGLLLLWPLLCCCYWFVIMVFLFSQTWMCWWWLMWLLLVCMRIGWKFRCCLSVCPNFGSFYFLIPRARQYVNFYFFFCICI